MTVDQRDGLTGCQGVVDALVPLVFRNSVQAGLPKGKRTDEIDGRVGVLFVDTLIFGAGRR